MGRSNLDPHPLIAVRQSDPSPYAGSTNMPEQTFLAAKLP